MFNRLAKLRAERARGEHGFTLIELLVVVVIIGILIAVAIPLYLNYRKGANDKAAQSDIRNAINVLEQCNTDNNTYPATADIGTTGGSITTGNCTGQSVNLSGNTTIKYLATASIPATTPVATYPSYFLWSTNSGGTKVYCYNSAVGGAVKTATATAATMAAATTCP